MTLPGQSARKRPWIVWQRVDEPGRGWYRVANYSTQARAEAAIPEWRKLYEDAGMPRLFMVAKR
jgi:hypothetical protein